MIQKSGPRLDTGNRIEYRISPPPLILFFDYKLFLFLCNWGDVELAHHLLVYFTRLLNRFREFLEVLSQIEVQDLVFVIGVERGLLDFVVFFGQTHRFWKQSIQSRFSYKRLDLNILKVSLKNWQFFRLSILAERVRGFLRTVLWLYFHEFLLHQGPIVEEL